MVRKSKYTKDLLEPIVSSSRSMGVVLDKLGLARAGGNYTNIKRHIKRHGISTAHFKRQGWSKGETKKTDRSVYRQAISSRIPNEEVFVKNSTYQSSRLKDRLIEVGWTYACEWCGISQWREREIRLHVDHINGDSADHRLSNLRFLCPNCHSQTKTYAGKNIQSKSKKYFCVECDTEITKGATRCKPCSNRNNATTKIDWPCTDRLLQMVEKTSYTEVGRELGVSDNAVRKRINTRSQ